MPKRSALLTGSVSTSAVAKSIERELEDAIDLSGVGGRYCRDTRDHARNVGEVHVQADGARVLRAWEQRLAGA